MVVPQWGIQVEQPINGDDPGEIETGDVIKRDPGADLAGDPGEIELVDLREGDQEAAAGAGGAWTDRSGAWGEGPDMEPEVADPGEDPGQIEHEEIVGDTGDRETDA